MCFCEAVIAASIKPCLKIFLDFFFFFFFFFFVVVVFLLFFFHYFKRSSIKVHFSVAVIIASVKPLNSNCLRHTFQARSMNLRPCP